MLDLQLLRRPFPAIPLAQAENGTEFQHCDMSV